MIMLSANPPYSGWLVEGLKNIEWRKKALPIDRALIYETKKEGGCGAMIGEVCIGRAYYVNADTASDYLIRNGMVDRNFLKKYSVGKPVYANEVWIAARYKKPRKLSEFGLSRPPQSWCYVIVM